MYFEIWGFKVQAHVSSHTKYSLHENWPDLEKWVSGEMLPSHWSDQALPAKDFLSKLNLNFTIIWDDPNHTCDWFVCIHVCMSGFFSNWIQYNDLKW
jgi:hypothetical protein